MPAAPSSTPTCCCCPARRTSRSGSGSPPRPCRGRTTPPRCSPRWPTARPGRWPGWRPSPTSAGRGWSCCSRCSPSTARSSGCRAAGGRPAQPWVYDADRYARVTRTREAEQRAMIAYARPVDEAECRMSFLQHALDDPTAAPCGRCDVCAGAWYSADVPGGRRRGRVGGARPARRRAGAPGAVAHRRRPARRRRQGQDRAGRPARDRPGRGPADRPRLGQRLRTLLGDDGVGGTVVLDLEAPGHRGGPGRGLRRARCGARSPTCRRTTTLLTACARVLGAWDWKERPGAVVAMPSRRRPQLVTGLAQGLARLGRLPYLGEMSLQHGGPTGQPGGNSAFRLAAVWDRIVVGRRAARAAGRAGLRRRSCSSTTSPTPAGR